TQVQKDTGIRVPDWGFTGAPYVHGELLVLTMGEAGVAVDKNSGKVVWKSANKDSGYSTPVPVAVGGREFLVLGSREHYIAIDPASGEEAWRIRWLTQYGVNAADPIHADGKLFVSSGYGKGAGLFDVTQRPPKQLWTSKVLG